MASFGPFMRRLALTFALCGATALAALACDTQAPAKLDFLAGKATPFVPAGKAVNPQWIGPWASGSFFAPSRSGEGIILEWLPDGRAIAFWFTYPLTGEAGEQAWLIAQGGSANGNRITFTDVYRPQGARFGDAFDPAAVSLDRWGTLELAFADCNTVTLSWSGPTGFGNGSRALTRLTALDELDCSGTTKRLTPTGGRSAAGLRAKSGAWYVPSRAGEGWILEELADGRGVVYWFTYDPQGRQAWLFGIAERNGETYEITDTLQLRGTRFGDAFDAGAIERRPWGRMTLAFDSCDALTVTYASTVAGYGSGTRNAARLTGLASAPCIAVRASPTTGAWTERARLPSVPQSEHAAVTVGNQIYVTGGFGDPRGFKRYDATTDSWSELPDLPAGRDHMAAFYFEGYVYYAGGSPQGGGVSDARGFRYDIANNRWEDANELPFLYGSQAAVLNGRAYMSDVEGVLYEYDPRRRVLRTIPAPNERQRDHGQVVAFLGEIWVMGGRTPETNSVAIFDPVTERWRFGPPMVRAHAGFAAAASGDLIYATGGEIISQQPYRIETVFETYTAGQQFWRNQGTMPAPLHGLPGAIVGNRFYIISGAGQPATANQITGRTWSWEFAQ